MKNFNRILFITLILLFSTTTAFAQASILQFNTKDINNKNITEAVFKDSKVTMINVWGTFCGPCINEMPDLGKLSSYYNKSDFQIIGIVIDGVNRKGTPDSKIIHSAKTIVEKTGADYLHIIPDSKLLNGVLRQIYAVPTTFFVNSKGQIIGNAYAGGRNFEDWLTIVESTMKSAE